MTSLNKSANIFSISISFFFIVIFVLACIFIKTKEKNVYKTIQIQLPQISKIENLTENKIREEKFNENLEAKSVGQTEENQNESKADNQQNAKLEQITQSDLTQKTQSLKNQNSSKTQKNQERVNQPKIRKSIEDLMAEQNAPKESKSSVDWTEDFSNQNEIPNVQNQNSKTEAKIATSKSSFSGTAGSLSSTNNSSSIGSSSKNLNQAPEVSNQTKSFLEELENTDFSSLGESQNQNTESKSKSSSSNLSSNFSAQKISIQTLEGRPRQLIFPSQPSIYLDEKNTSGIETSLHVSIKFTITANGSVPIGQISFSPASVLSTELQSEIREQISKWTFSQDPNGSSGTAAFEYTIEVK